VFGANVVMYECLRKANNVLKYLGCMQGLGTGAPLGQLLVLERLEGVALVRLTRKASMVAAAAQLPRDFDKLKEGALLPGYVASVTADAVFVRFLDKLTGRTGIYGCLCLFLTTSLAMSPLLCLSLSLLVSFTMVPPSLCL
jgi:hypothetical protein